MKTKQSNINQEPPNNLFNDDVCPMPPEFAELLAESHTSLFDLGEDNLHPSVHKLRDFLSLPGDITLNGDHLLSEFDGNFLEECLPLSSAIASIMNPGVSLEYGDHIVDFLIFSCQNTDFVFDEVKKKKGEGMNFCCLVNLIFGDADYCERRFLPLEYVEDRGVKVSCFELLDYLASHTSEKYVWDMSNCHYDLSDNSYYRFVKSDFIVTMFDYYRETSPIINGNELIDYFPEQHLVLCRSKDNKMLLLPFEQISNEFENHVMADMFRLYYRIRKSSTTNNHPINNIPLVCPCPSRDEFDFGNQEIILPAKMRKLNLKCSGKFMSQSLVLDSQKEHGMKIKPNNRKSVEKHQKLDKDIQSIDCGISFNKNTNRWDCYWCEDGKQKSKSFSLAEYGENAKQLAIDYRLKMDNEGKASKKSKGSSGINGVRFDKGGNRWMAQWLENGRKKAKSFSISNYGENAKQFAIDYRLKMEIEGKASKKSKGSSGINGVSFMKKENTWKAEWYENGRKKIKCFSIFKYGENAKQLAIDYRREVEESGRINSRPIV